MRTFERLMLKAALLLIANMKPENSVVSEARAELIKEIVKELDI